MRGKPGSATKLAYQLYVKLNTSTKPSLSGSIDSRKDTARALERRLFEQQLKKGTPRQTSIDQAKVNIGDICGIRVSILWWSTRFLTALPSQLESSFRARGKAQEAAALKAAAAEEKRQLAARKANHEATLKRQREIKQQYVFPQALRVRAEKEEAHTLSL